MDNEPMAIWVSKNMFGIQKTVQKRFYSVLNRVFSNKKRPRRTSRNTHQRLNEVGSNKLARVNTRVALVWKCISSM